MIESKITTVFFIEIRLEKKQAEILKGLIQNAQIEDEPKEISEFREDLWIQLDKLNK